MEWLSRLAGGALYAAGGFCAFLLLYMRVLNRMSSGPVKRFVALGSFGLFLGGGTLLGLWRGLDAWAWAPLAPLVLHVVLELDAARHERRARGAPPVEVVPPPVVHRLFTSRDLHLRRYRIEAPPVLGAPLRIAHLSDLHINDRMPAAYYRELTARVRAAEPDLVLFSGDFAFGDLDSRLLDETLAGLPARLGRFAVLGNHDYSAGAEAIAAQLAAAGITVLRNGCGALPLPGGARAVVCGDDTPWQRRSDALPTPAEGELLLGLSHTSDNAPRFARAGAFAVFSGHFHGGQLRWPLIGPAAVPSRYGRRYHHGHYRLGATHLFVSAGVGITFPPFRVSCPPDWFLVDLVPA